MGKQNRKTVQETNDSSILSKASMSSHGYFHDPFLLHFVQRKVRRSPLINRGYYVRAKAIDYKIRSFLSAHEKSSKQIISLGAGFDTTYFRLKSFNSLSMCRYYEIDFADVVKRKQNLIVNQPKLSEFIDGLRIEESNLLSQDYFLLSCDLTDINLLFSLLTDIGVDFSLPTLIFSECVLTYVDPIPTKQLLKLFQSSFEHCEVCIYEQVYPFDAFGQVMLKHFNKLQSPLKRLHILHNIRKHVELFEELAFKTVVGIDMNFFYNNYLDIEERRRVESLEMFDEFEEWHLKCSHYCIITAFQGRCVQDCRKTFPYTQNFEEENQEFETGLKVIGLPLFDCSTLLQRFGHASVRQSECKYLITGGFGMNTDFSHTKVCHGFVFNSEAVKRVNCDQRMFHTLTYIDDRTVFVYGGRRSPKETCCEYGTFALHEEELTAVDLISKCSCSDDSVLNLPICRWRHAAAKIGDDIFICGGRSPTEDVLSDVWGYNCSNKVWKKMMNMHLPRHSHTMEVWDDHLLIYGGMTAEMQVLNDIAAIHVRESTQCKQLLFIPPLPERYSHTSHIIGDQFLVVGGVDPTQRMQLPVIVALLREGTWRQYHYELVDPEYPLMLHNNCSFLVDSNKILLMGGGGNCFSFGTHFNKGIKMIEISDPLMHRCQEKNNRCTNERLHSVKKKQEVMIYKREPGDGCTSEDDSVECEDTIEKNMTDDDDSIDLSLFDDSVMSADIGVEDEIFNEDASEQSCTDLSNLSSSVTSSSLLSNRIASLSSVHLQLSQCSLKDAPPLPLLQSLFPNRLPTLYFTVEGEDVGQFPAEIRRVLKWRSSTVTPKVVKACIARTGFHLTRKSSDWLGLWGKHMKSASFKLIQPFQKVNHFPGTFHIGRKDKLWRNFTRMKSIYGKGEFNFIPQTFVLPHDLDHLKRNWDDGGGKLKWIVKPPASARGLGIKVINKWNQVPKKRQVIVQRYISKPYLINGCKFDLRIYVYISSYDPLRLYIFEDGLVRFATTKYSSASKSLHNKYMHLTNYSINKKNEKVYNNEEHIQHKWTLKELWSYFHKRSFDIGNLWTTIKDIAVKVIICGESPVNSLIVQNMKNRYSCHELFGLDILLDSHLKPWLLEVNISPSLHSNSDLDKCIKSRLVKEVLNLASFYMPKSKVVGARCSGVHRFTADHDTYKHKSLSSDEKAKHTFYIKRHADNDIKQTILDVLTPDDVMMLLQTEDEFSRCESFERIMPSHESKNYLEFFTTPRYYNLLLDEWTKRYHGDKFGIGVLRSLAAEKVHLQIEPNVSLKHQWHPVKDARSRIMTLHSSTDSLSSRKKKRADGFAPLKKSVAACATNTQKNFSKIFTQVRTDRSK